MLHDSASVKSCQRCERDHEVLSPLICTALGRREKLVVAIDWAIGFREFRLRVPAKTRS